MSQSKGVAIFDRQVWVLDCPHDVVVAHMAEVAEKYPVIDRAWIQRWHIDATIPDCGLHISPCAPEIATALRHVITEVRQRVVEHGSVGESDLANWSVLEDLPVSLGELRGGVALELAQLLDVVDGFHDMFHGVLEPNPPGTWWYLGTSGGRRTIAMREPGAAAEP